MNIRTKLFILLGTLICSLIFLGTFSILELTSTDAQNAELNDDIQAESHLKHVQYRLAGISNDERAFLIQGDPDFPAQMQEKADDTLKSIQYVKEHALSPEEKKRIAEIEEAFNTYWDVSKKVVEAYDSDKELAHSLHFGQEREIRKQLLDPKINEYIESLGKEAQADKERMAENRSQFIILSISLTAAMSILGIVFGLIIIYSIVKPLKQLIHQMKEISEGEADLTKQIIVKNKDELGEVSQSFNHFIQSIREIIANIKSSSEQVAASSEEFSANAEQSKRTSEHVAFSMQEIAAGASRQSSMTEQSNISLRESAVGLSNITSFTADVAAMATGVKEKAEIGASSVNKIVNQMQSIHSSVEGAADGIVSLPNSASKISNITALINEIAGQTNLLALNAAIEAARAGEHGKGFAVVAEEVRKLAEQSSKSANQINEIVVVIQSETEHTVDAIENVKEDVTSGQVITTETSTQFNDILDSIEMVSSQLQEIAATAQQLASGFDMVTSSVAEISSLTKATTSGSEAVAASTQEQLASSEEILNAANSLASLAEELQSVIRRFKI
nr:HAMP domain-containing methyl-accepting chemotaxis protein [Bacillus sp. T33-2]